MIVSHKHKFIFIHCRKVAGSSVKVALAPHLGEDDIVIGSIHEILASGGKLNRAAKNSLLRPLPLAKAVAARLVGKSWGEAVNIGVKSFYFKRLSKNPPHPTAEQISSFFVDEWRDYFKFAFVRNPFDQVVSDYMWRRRATGVDIEFIHFLQELKSGSSKNRLAHLNAVSNLEMISIKNEIVVDMVGRYETLNEDFQKIVAKLGISGVSLGKPQKRTNNKPALTSFFGPREIDIVHELFHHEIEKFGYEVPEHLVKSST